MNEPEPFAVLIDDLLPDREELIKRVQQLTADLAQSRAAREVQCNLARDDVAVLQRRLSTCGSDLTEAIAGHRSQLQATRRLAAEQVQTLRALRELLSVCADVCLEEGWIDPCSAFAVKMRQAGELLQILDIPFA